MVAAPTAVSAHNAPRWVICPAADTVPSCEIIRAANQADGAGSAVTGRRTATQDGSERPLQAPEGGCRLIGEPHIVVCPSGSSTDRADDVDGGCRLVGEPHIVACRE
jgi:hypothetical protein